MSIQTDSQQVIYQLDTVYQSILDRLESQVRDATLIDLALRKIISQEDSETSLLDWNPERAISPREAFRALATRLIEQLQPHIDSGVVMSESDYADLLHWETGQLALPGMSCEQIVLANISYARRKSLMEFWRNLTNRVAPDANPESALLQASRDLAQAWVRQTPEARIIPFRERETFTEFPMHISRGADQPEWVLPHSALMLITRANHALATLATLDKDNQAARNLRDCTAHMTGALRQSYLQYEPRQAFYAGGTATIQLSRDVVAFRLEPKLFTRAKDAITRHVSDVQFMPSERIVAG